MRALDLLDVDTFTADILAGLDGVTVAPDLEDQIRLPAVIYRASGEGQSGNGPGLWRFRLDLQVLGTPTRVFQTTRDVYALMHSLPGRATRHGLVCLVEDEQMPERQPTSMLGQKAITQTSAAFRLVVDTNRKAL